MDKILLKLEKELEFEVGDNKEYEVKAIIDSAVYDQYANNSNQIPGLYYLVLWKSYLKEENTWEHSSAVIYLRKLINTFHKKHLKKPTAISPPLDSTPPMARQTVSKEPKQKRGHPSKRVNKRGRNQIAALKPLKHTLLDVILKPLIQSFQFLSSISIRFSSLFFYLGFGGFSPPQSNV